MKYLITESQRENLIFKYLDNQDFIQVNGPYNEIFFVNSEGDEYSQIRYDKEEDGGTCYVYHKLIGEISSFFSLDEKISKQLIGNWVKNTLQMSVKYVINIPHISAMAV